MFLLSLYISTYCGDYRAALGKRHSRECGTEELWGAFCSPATTATCEAIKWKLNTLYIKLADRHKDNCCLKKVEAISV